LRCLFGTVGIPEKNLIPDALLEKNGIELVKGEVVDIARRQKKVILVSGKEIGYDKLILATGSLPIELPIPGLDKENVFIVKKDIAYLSKMLEVMNRVKDVIIIGEGFIGVEFADECRKHRNCADYSVTIIEILPRRLQMAFDTEFCEEAGT